MTETNTHHYASIKNTHGNLLNTTETKSVVLRFLCNTANCFNNRLKYNFELSAVIREKKGKNCFIVNRIMSFIINYL